MRYTDILTEENANYESMVQGFRNLLARHDIEVGGNEVWPVAILVGEIKWAKRILRRKDRIIWYIRHARIKLISDIIEMEATKLRDRMTAFIVFSKKDKSQTVPQKSEMHLAMEDVLADALKRYEHTMGHSYHVSRNENYVRQFTHFMSFTDRSPEINEIRWLKQSPAELVGQLIDAEHATYEREKADNRYVTNQPKDQVILSFPDGFQWVMLDRSGCSEEGMAMGHCGNVGHSGEKILSLRKANHSRKGKGRLEPYLTFILHKGGVLGEMKGKYNKKPSSDLHPYIIALLKDKRIKGIAGGGYLPQNNFSISDLTQEEQAELEALKPSLFTRPVAD